MPLAHVSAHVPGGLPADGRRAVFDGRNVAFLVALAWYAPLRVREEGRA